jgi:putative PIN family toxin of toxin-antitoxin system
MRAVLDTNVLVSGTMYPHRVPGQVLDLATEGKCGALYDQRILTEYQEVLKRPHFKFNHADIDIMINSLKQHGEEIEGPFPQLQLVDKTDEKFLEVAWAGLADALVTGNGKHFPARQTGLVKIRSPREFLDLI